MPASQIALMRNRVMGLLEMNIKQLRIAAYESLSTPILKSTTRNQLIHSILFHEFERKPSR